MKRVRVGLGKRSYDILIGNGILKALKSELKKLKLGKVAVIVTNPTIGRLYGHKIKQALKGCGYEINLLEVPDSEESKSFKECIYLVNKFAKMDKGRGIFVIALGGGVIGDLAGFCASIYRRGVPYIQVPTTLLAQVDSSIGGKVAVDLLCGKNLAGSFYQPKLVLSDVDFLKTLSNKQIRVALAEIIKYGVIADKKFFYFLERNLEEVIKLKKEKLQYIVNRCSEIKAKVVARDEYDKTGKRMILNFGHTAGHAIEAAGGYSKNYPHGYAVAVGMLVACEIARELKMISRGKIERIENLITQAKLPTRIVGLKLKNILRAQAHDKKFISGKNRFVLPVSIGKVVVRKNISQRIIIRAITSRFK
ncbi:MAG: 3-dehydroquinate synthase [Candidatus Omnitrophica bacterium]|nr:3-dehydroquinate synthase [Candidatus Omnitrophota bacterium]